MRPSPADDALVRRLFHKVTAGTPEPLTPEEGLALIYRIERDRGALDAVGHCLRGVQSSIATALSRHTPDAG